MSRTTASTSFSSSNCSASGASSSCTTLKTARGRWSWNRLSPVSVWRCCPRALCPATSRPLAPQPAQHFEPVHVPEMQVEGRATPAGAMKALAVSQRTGPAQPPCTADLGFAGRHGFWSRCSASASVSRCRVTSTLPYSQRIRHFQSFSVFMRQRTAPLAQGMVLPRIDAGLPESFNSVPVFVSRSGHHVPDSKPCRSPGRSCRPGVGLS